MSGHNPHTNSASDFGHLLNSSNHNGTSVSNHHHNNNNNHNVNNIAQNGDGGDTKPKKVPPPNGKKTKGRVKIKMEFIDNKLRRYTTFSKRKTGIMKKAYELSTLTGTQVMLLVASETGHVYTFATRKLQPMITSEAGKALIQTCLNSPDPPNSGSDSQRMSATGYEETELTYAADPNGSEQEEEDNGKDTESCSGSEDSKEVPALLPLSNGMVPPNFAALLATAGLGVKGGLTIDNIMQQHGGGSLSSSRGQSSSIMAASSYPSFASGHNSNNNLMSSSNHGSKSKKQKRDSK